jgi:O-antigen/teichoic acid export membrane protein
MENNKKTIGFGILTNYFQYILSILLGIILSPLVLKYAGQETMGAYAILLQVISYISLIELGIGFSASRFLSQSFAIGKDEFVSTSNMYRSVAILQNTVMAVLFVILSIYIQELFHFSDKLAGEMKIGLWILASWTFVSSPWTFYSGILYTTNYMSAQNLIDALTNTLKILLAILFVIRGWSIIGLIASQVISQLFGLFAKWYYSNKKNGKIKFQFSLAITDKFKEILVFSFNSFLITIAIKLVFSTDNIVIGYLYGPVAVSIYYLTFQPGNMLNQFILRITDNFTPSVNIWYANGEYDKLKSTFFFLFRITFFFTVLMMWGIVFCTEPIITLWVGKANYLAQPMSLWCGLFAASIVLGHVPNAFVMADGRIKMLSYFALFEGLLNLTLSFILGKIMGTHAIMLATLIANLPTSLYLYYKATNVLDCKTEFIGEFFQWKYLVAVLLIPTVWVASKKILDYYNIVQTGSMLSTSILVCITYPLAIYFMYHNLLLIHEKEKIGTLLKFKKG